MDYQNEASQSASSTQGLRGIVDEVNNALREAHAVLSELEDKLTGPRPREATQDAMAKSLPAPHPGVRAATELASKTAYDLMGRIARLSDTL